MNSILSFHITYSPPTLAIQYQSYHSCSTDQHRKKEQNKLHVIPLFHFLFVSLDSAVESIMNQHVEMVDESTLSHTERENRRGKIKKQLKRLIRLVRVGKRGEEEARKEFDSFYQSQSLGTCVDDERTQVEPVLISVDLNKVSTKMLSAYKESMDEAFIQNVVKPTDSDFVYDKRMDFDVQSGTNEWDDE